MSQQPQTAPTASAILLPKLVGRPGTESLQKFLRSMRLQ